MASSRSSALQDGRTTDHKEMAAIAADRLAGRQPEDDGVPMENMVVDDPAPTPSSAPFLAGVLHHDHRRGPCPIYGQGEADA